MDKEVDVDGVGGSASCIPTHGQLEAERKTVARFQQKQATQSTPDWRRCRPILFPPAAAQFPPENLLIQCQHHLISCEAVKW